MKTLYKLLVIILLTTGNLVTANVARSQVSASVSFSVFYNDLQPYGRWVRHARYGDVWIPRVSGFRPYSTDGHWAYTDYGWTWVSDYDWGWAPFHYGRWAYDPAYGWVWVPGYEWGPAWVSWRTSDDYYGWAPLTPDVNIGIGVSFGTSIPVDFWIFAPARYITSPVVYRYYVPRTNNVTIIRRTRIINNVREADFSNHRVVVVGGPRREDVEKVTRQQITVMHVGNASKPGRESVDRSKNTVNIYRPVINKTTVNKTVVNEKTINNNKEVNKTTNNTTVNKNSNNKTVNKNQQPEKKPATQKPDNSKPANNPNTKPDNQKPDNSKPANNPNTKPDNQKPDNSKPANNPNTKPDNQKPDNSKPANNPNTKPDNQKPDNSKPANHPNTKPDNKPDNSKPANSKPGNKPDNHKPDNNKPDSNNVDGKRDNGNARNSNPRTFSMPNHRGGDRNS